MLFLSGFGLLSSASVATTSASTISEANEQELLKSLRLSTQEIKEAAKEFNVNEEFVQSKLDELIEEVESATKSAGLEPPSANSVTFSLQKPSFNQQGSFTFRVIPPVIQATEILGEFEVEINKLKHSIKTLENKI